MCMHSAAYNHMLECGDCQCLPPYQKFVLYGITKMCMLSTISVTS